MVVERATEFLAQVRRDAEIARLRARNGIRLAGGRRPTRSGLTPKDVVWKHGNTELWHYVREPEPTGGSRPAVLIVHSLVSRSYVFDLQPGSSFIGSLLDVGIDVFLLDWGVPDDSDSGNTLETYVDDLMPPAMSVVHEITGEPVHLLGYCLGGILGLLYAARHGDQRLATLTTLAAPIDFDQLGMVVSMLRDGRVSIDDVVDESGNIPPDVFRQLFQVMQPTASPTQYVNLLQNLWKDDYVEGHQAMSRWIGDHIPFPGALARQLTEVLIRKNALYDGSLVLGGRRVDLADVTCPTLCVLAERDHIVPIEAAGVLPSMLPAAECSEVRLPAGHVALVMGRLSKSVLVPALRRHFDSPQFVGKD